jgi:GT2 family glycosyltransferase
VRNLENFGFALGNNIGFAESRGSRVVFLNNDTEVTPEWLRSLVRPLENPDIQGAQPKLLYPDGSIQHAGHRYRTAPTHAFYQRRNRRAALGELVIDRENDGVTGALFLQHKSVWRAVGGFNENFPLNYNDVDYCLKVRALGYRIIQVNSTEALHHESQTRDAAVSQDEIDRIFSRWPYSFTSDAYTRN